MTADMREQFDLIATNIDPQLVNQHFRDECEQAAKVILTEYESSTVKASHIDDLVVGRILESVLRHMKAQQIVVGGQSDLETFLNSKEYGELAFVAMEEALKTEAYTYAPQAVKLIANDRLKDGVVHEARVKMIEAMDEAIKCAVMGVHAQVAGEQPEWWGTAPLAVA